MLLQPRVELDQQRLLRRRRGDRVGLVLRLPLLRREDVPAELARPEADILFLKLASSIFRQSSNPVCGFSMMKQVRLFAVLPTENWLGSSMTESHTRLEDCLRMLLSFFKKMMSDLKAVAPSPFMSISPMMVFRPSRLPVRSLAFLGEGKEGASSESGVTP